MTAQLSDEVKLPCGAVLKNRIAKAAMTKGPFKALLLYDKTEGKTAKAVQR